MLIAQSKAEVAETVERIEMVLPIESIILSVPPKSLDALIWSCIRVVTDSTEVQLWSCMASECSANVKPVFSLYVRKAESKSARKRVDRDWSTITQSREEMWLWKGVLVRCEETIGRQGVVIVVG